MRVKFSPTATSEDPPGQPVGTIQQLANYINTGYWAYSGYQGTAPRHWAPGATISVNIQDLTTAERGMATLALQYWSSIANINFTFTPGAAQIVYNNNGSGIAHCLQTVSGTTLTSATVEISSNWGNANVLGSYMFQTYLHETGHALGLGHQGAYNGSATFGTNNVYQNDSWRLSVMSYFDQAEAGTGSFAYVMTGQTADILAMHDAYGLRAARTGDTTYGFNSNAGSLYDFNVTSNANGVSFTIYDTGGIDTLDGSGYANNSAFDLRSGNFSSLGGETNNIGIYTSTVVENANGGAGNELFYGNTANNVISGNGGFDTVVFSGNRSDFFFVETNGYVVTGGGQGTDTLNSIEQFTFNDTSVIDDYRGGTLTTAALTVGSSRDGTTQFNGDRDWFKISLVAGQTYVFTERGADSGAGTQSDAFLNFYNSSGAEVTSNDDSGIGFDARILHTAATTDTYFLGASGFNSSLGTYKITAQQMMYGESDFNADGQADVLWRDYTSGETGYYRNVQGSFSYVQLGTVGQNFVLVGTGDFNGDGATDILWRDSQTNETGIYQFNGSGLFDWLSFGRVGGNFSVLGVADFSGDHRADILWRDLFTGETGYYEMNGTSFDWRSVGVVDSNFSTYGLADYNGDRIDDILWRNEISGETGMYLMDGRGGFTWQSLGIVDNAFEIVNSADFDGNQVADVLWRNSGTGETGAYLMNNNGNYQWQSYGVVDKSYSVVGTGDYNGDHFDDIMWRNLSTGETGYYAMNGRSFQWTPYANVETRWDLV